ncbi:MAG: hypothetical protein JWP61_2030, partial [Friedmanniella sp.]|nr:hypothetical protein [Friedmanniella sp.]
MGGDDTGEAGDTPVARRILDLDLDPLTGS